MHLSISRDHGSHQKRSTGTMSVVTQKNSNLGMAVSVTKPADELWGRLDNLSPPYYSQDSFLKVSSKLERPFCTIYLHCSLSEFGSILRALRPFLKISLYLRWSLPVGHVPCNSSLYRRSFRMRPSSIRTTWPIHCMRLCLRRAYIHEPLLSQGRCSVGSCPTRLYLGHNEGNACERCWAYFVEHAGFMTYCCRGACSPQKPFRPGLWFALSTCHLITLS